MAHVEIPEGEGSERARLWSLRPEFAEAAEHFNHVINSFSILPVRESEAARARMAHINQCEPCSEARVVDGQSYGLDEAFYAGLDSKETRHAYSARERLAIEFAERFDAGKDAFDEQFWSEMRLNFSSAEILDLAMSVAKWLAFGRMNAVFDLVPLCPVEIRPGSGGVLS